ncbi:HTTM domain-containing protein [Nannocystis bainbridge]|uniref:HTTM domain-containing protein n=1 Tax=Nannocystis bainbridge TaxID=2995303 RepID=A0ABT5DQB7_9BACT|nr:HTTM domain-containing protein [Nannocystis bainbridge]MDC0715857.1 HTTM domain-containing protein [Nannocystis bainbridge]
MHTNASSHSITRREEVWVAAGLSGSGAAASGLGVRPRLPLRERLFAPVDIASLVVFRVVFGLLMIVDVWRYYGKIDATYIQPGFHFTYYGFDWVRPWPGDGMYVHFLVLALAAAGVMVGCCYRAAATVFFLGFSYWFLLEQARYLNHFYLIALLAFVMIVLPAHRAFAVDAWLRPRLRAATVPAWALWLVRFQIAVPYLFGGIAKLNGDWLQGEPMRMWLAARASRPIVGPLFTQEWVVYFFSWGGLLFDLAIVPLLLWRRSRPFAFVAALLFNLVNGYVFTIGIFPWVMAAATLMFCEPDWPRRCGRVLARLFGLRPAGLSAPRLFVRPRERVSLSLRTGLRPGQRWTLALLGTYCGFQLLFPLRHWLYPGDVAWTEEGHKFSWRMKLRDKESRVRFLATDPHEERTWEVDARQYLTPWQRTEMSGRPEMILQFAHHLAADLRAQGHEDLQIRAVANVSLNGRAPQLMIDPEVDLVKQPRSILPAPWILPMAEPALAPERRL